MDLISIFWILWGLVLPMLGVITPIFSLVFWFFVVPKIARMFTGAKFKNVSIHAIADDSGYVELVTTNVELPESVVRTKRGWRVLPSLIFKSLKGRKKKNYEELVAAEKIATRKYILKGLGKPFWLGYAGMVTATNPATLAVLQQSKNSINNPQIHFDKIKSYIKSLPKQFIWNNQTKKDLTKMLEKLEGQVESEPLTLVDPRAIKEVLVETTSPSTMDAVEAYAEMVGMEERGKEYGKLIMGGAILAVILILGIVAIATLG